MKEKRTVILFGAGAVFAWGGPKTSCLTMAIRDSAPNFICNDGKTKITEFIYDTLLKSGYKEEDINFETIINVIEELIIHYAYFDGEKKLLSLNKTFFSSRFEEEILNFLVEGDRKKPPYKLQIPKGVEYTFGKYANNNESPEQLFFQDLLSEILTQINLQISKYSIHSKTATSNNIGNCKEPLNNCFQKWIQKISENAVIRMYTLNYDRIFKVLAERVGISVFEGFECGEFIPEEGVFPNVQRILTDFNSHIHYNLHGSAFWEVKSRDENSELFNPWISLQQAPIFESNSLESTVVQMEKGKNILVSNIITGYQKTQKSFITPFKQMQSVFDKDCYLADDIYIIGYSLGDAHISASIKIALKYNDKLKLHFVDPAYDEKDGKNGYKLLTDRIIYILPELLNPLQLIKEDIDENTCCYFDGKLTVYTIGFDKIFLNKYLA